MKKISLFLLPIVFAGILTGCSLWGSSNENSDQTTGDQTVATEPVNQGDNQNIDSQVDADPVGGMYVVTNPADVLEKAKKSANLANEKARKWQSDAKLILLSTNYFSSLNDEGVIDKFIYSSDINTELYFSIDINRSDQKFTRTLIYRDDYRLKSGVLPIPIKYWKITYAQALEKADMLGGYQFRKDHPNYQVSQMLSLADGKNLAWYIIYSAPGSDQSFRITIDSSTGEQIL